MSKEKIKEWASLFFTFQFREILKRLKYHFNDGNGLYVYNDYAEYKETQIEGNRKKINNVWVSEENIEFLSNYIKKNIPQLNFGICHGTRNGAEQRFFKKYLGVEVIGTEISPTATQFPDTIEWDFHEVKDEWLDSVDFIYSNSFDHSYDPERCLDAWMSCIKSSGVCIFEWTGGHISSSKLDPFGGTKRTYKKLINKKYQIKDILKGGYTGGGKNWETTFFVVAHK